MVYQDVAFEEYQLRRQADDIWENNIWTAIDLSQPWWYYMQNLVVLWKFIIYITKGLFC